MGEKKGPLGLACQEIRIAIDRFASDQRRGRRLPSLIARTDQLLAELETLNLRKVRRVPSRLRSELVVLVGDLPFEYMAPLRQQPSPTAAIDLVFDIQQGLFPMISGTAINEPDWKWPVDRRDERVSSCLSS